MVWELCVDFQLQNNSLNMVEKINEWLMTSPHKKESRGWNPRPPTANPVLRNLRNGDVQTNNKYKIIRVPYLNTLENVYNP